MQDARIQARFDDLEARPARLDELVAKAVTIEDMAEAAAKRRFLLLDLEAEGLFEVTLSQEIASMLPHLPFLRGYRDAAVRLRSYLQSPVRTKFIKTEPPRSLTTANVSLDWFRFPQPVPEGFGEDEWLAYCEFTMTSVELGSGGGEIFFKVREKLCTLLWRMEDGIHPAIFKVRL
jgi:hypothetical protein